MGYKLHPPGSRRGNRTYVIRGTVGKRRFEAITNATTREAAEQWAIDYIGALKSESVSGPSVTFDQAAGAYLSLKNPRKLDRRNIERLTAFFRDKLLGEIVGADLIAAAHALLPRGSNAHKNRTVITPASAILHYAAEQGWCGYSRHRRLKVSRRSSRKPAPAAVMRLLLANTTGPKRLLLAWLYETGMRVTDSVRLADDALDLQACRARIASSKTDDIGEIGLSPELVAMLAVSPRYPGNRVFPWNSRTSVYKWLVPLCRRLGVSYTPHQSRHALATDLRALGWDMEAIAERGLWADARSTARYVHHRATDTPGRSVGNILGVDPGRAARKALKSND